MDGMRDRGHKEGGQTVYEVSEAHGKVGQRQSVAERTESFFKSTKQISHFKLLVFKALPDPKPPSVSFSSSSQTRPWLNF